MRSRRRSKRDEAKSEPPAKAMSTRRRSAVEAPPPSSMAPLRREDHAQSLALVLSAAGETGRFADVKMVCGLGGDGGGANDPASVLWSHSFLLAAASPFLAGLLREDSGGGDHALHLPDVRPAHLRMVLDYLYTGAMYLTAADLAPVLGVIETLRMTCGVSVSKMVRKTEPQPSVSFSGRRRRPPAALRETWQTTETKAAASSAAATTKWVEEAKFGGGLDQIKRELTEGEEEDEAAHPLPDDVDLPRHLPYEEQRTPDLEAAPQPGDGASHPPDSESVQEDDPMGDDRMMRRSHDDESGAFEVVAGSSDEEDLDESSEAAVEVHPDQMSDTEKESEDRDDERAADHKCVMCGKTFQHADNLRAHIQNHLGVKAQLNSCPACKRIFRSSLELDLHEMSHKFAKFQRRRLSKDKLTAAEVTRRQLVRAAVAYFVRKWDRERKEKLRKEAEERRQREAKLAKAKAKLGRKKLTVSLEKMKVPTSSIKAPPTPSSSSALTLKVKFPHAAMLEQQLLRRTNSMPEQQSNYCAACERNFSTAGSLRRHVKNFHNGVVVVPRHRAGSGVDDTDDSEHEAGSQPKRPRGRPPKSPLAKVNKRKRSRASSSADDGPSPARPKAESDLTCPTCDKTFPAKSIFERHLKTAHQQGSLSSAPFDPPLGSPFFPSTPSSSALPHLNKVVQPTMEVGGMTVNKYECHLCNKVFLRVKDLAKHREKACSAWM